MFASKSGKREKIMERLTIANSRVKQLLAKLNNQISILDEREKILFERLVSLIEYKDSARANIVASEISQIRNLKKHLLAFQVVLENISLRIDNIILIGDISKDLPTLLGIVREARNIIKGVFPGMEIEFIALEEDLKGVATEMKDFSIYNSMEYNPSASSDAKKILEEAYLVAEERIRSSMPKVGDRDLKIKS
ncbi:MAG: Snf7 family protein [Sulfolobales archaeon]